ncbi:uncharacterized protein [Palaemon carinicauda]|uniref:uncharacterized protein n=1 Tax=Palaemon carinicauda TaxID=392227 RepID=UPI0035B5A43A
MSEHLRKVRNEETHVHYLGINIQNEVIDILANASKEEILKNACAAEYFSIILDSTPDVSHVEQMTVIIRFVQVDEDNAVIAVREHFLGYVPLQETTGAFMAETILEELKKMDLCIDNLRGQGYDNGSNMKALKQLECTRMFPEERRGDTEFEKVLVDASELANDLEIDPVFVADSVRLRKKKRQFDYEGKDKPVQNAKVNLKVNFYFAVLDVAINSVLERLQQLQQMKSVFGFLYDVKSINGITNTQLMEHCTKLKKALRDGESKDIDATDLCHELQAVARRLQPDTVTPLDVLKFLCEQGLVHSVPNTFVALHILLTLPVTEKGSAHCIPQALSRAPVQDSTEENCLNNDGSTDPLHVAIVNALDMHEDGVLLTPLKDKTLEKVHVAAEQDAEYNSLR